jgi:hypothetical protein
VSATRPINAEATAAECARLLSIALPGYRGCVWSGSVKADGNIE